MIHAACSNSNHLQTRQKPDADKGWRNQCRLGTAILLISSAFPSEHLGYQERRLLLFLGLFSLPGLPGEIMSAGAVRRGERASGAVMSGLPPQLPVHPSLGSPQCFRHTWRNSDCHLACGSESSVTPTEKSWSLRVWLTHPSDVASVVLCSTLEEERTGWDLNWCRCFITASPQTWMEVDWLCVWTHTEALS